jgi:hypothetical protein
MRSGVYALLVALLVASTLAIPSFALAHTPAVSITAPADGATIYTAFPAVVAITTQVVHDQLQDLNAFDVVVDNVSILPLGALGNPFPANTCSPSQMDAPHGISSCSANALTSTGSVTTPWSVNGPGTYSITVVTRHRSTEGEDDVAVTLALLNVEHPAPPAVANGFLNATYDKKALTSRIRGCVISMIAENHAKYSAYGPKGGPYDEAIIQGDAAAYLKACGGI